MASDTKNVKLGVCKVYFDGVDLGYTKGGVEVSVKTETHKVMVDQFGKTAINEYIMGREVSVKVPLAETTLDNMVRIMPGAVLTSDGVKASATATYSGQPVANDTLVINGATFAFKAVATGARDIAIGANLAESLANAAAKISADPATPVAATASATILTLTAETVGVAGNSTTIAKVGTTVTLSGATLSGGSDATVQKVEVPTGIGTNLLDIAKSLVLHPVNKVDGDTSEDFTVFKAATAGALNFAYKLEDERIFSCEFNGYPDVNGKMFAIG